MKSHKDYVYSILEFVSGFQVTDDNPIDPELISKKMDDVRATLIKQELTQDGYVNDLYFQMVDVVIDKENIDPKNEIDIKQFYVLFPELIPNVGWANIRYLGKNDLRQKYNRRTMDGYISGSSRRWSSNMIDYTVIGPSKALIRNEKVAKDIIVIGLFKSPLDIKGFTEDSQYPVPDPFKFEMIVKQDILAGLGVKSDEKNDSRHNQEEILGGQRRR